MPAHLLRLLAGWNAALLIGGAAATARAATPSPEQRVEALRKRATVLAAHQRWPAAIATLVRAEEAIRGSEHRSAAKPGAGNPAYQRDLQKLQAWATSRSREVKKGNGSFEELSRDVRARKAELDRRYKIHPAVPATAAPDEHGQLLLASLEDTIAGYSAKRGDAASAVLHRREAASLRIRLYQAVKKPELAAQVAEKLTKANPEDAASFETSAQCFQEQGAFERAVTDWQAAIRLLERGKVPRPANPNADPLQARARRLSVDYRQLAFCFTRSGKSREAADAMEAARKADAQARVDLKRR
jgi:tetratricopeptide (TPR) repeat protein